MYIICVAAITMDNGIGYKNDLPWSPKRIRIDQKFFKTITTSIVDIKNDSENIDISINEKKMMPIIMGRRTMESLPGPLKNRTNIVISSREKHTNK